MRPNQIVAFVLDDRRYGLPLCVVDRIVRMVEVTYLPKRPDIFLGVVDVQKRVIPVINDQARGDRFKMSDTTVEP